MEEPVSGSAHWVPVDILEELQEAGGEEYEENIHQFDKSLGCGNNRLDMLTASCREVPVTYAAPELEEVNNLQGAYELHEFQAEYTEQQADVRSDCHSVSSDMLMSQAVDAEASLRAEILDLGRRMRTAEPDMGEREFLAASNSNGSVHRQDIGSCSAFNDERAFSAASTIDEVGMPTVANGWSHEDHEEPSDGTDAVIRPGLRGLAAAAGGPLFCDYLVDGDDDLGLDTPEAIWRPPLMRRPPDRPVKPLLTSNGGPAESYPSAPAAEEAGVLSVGTSPRKPPPGSATATPRPRVRGRAGATPPIASSGGSAASSLAGSGGSNASGSVAGRRAQVLERAQQPTGSNRAPHGMQLNLRGPRPARSAEVQALQAEVAMQEVQLRRLLTAQPGENIPDEVAFEAARLWQGLESIRSVIGTLQERIGEEATGCCQEELSTSDAGFVEDAYVTKADSQSQGSRGRISTGGSMGGDPDGFDEIARLEAATSILTRQPRSRYTAGVAQEERGQAPMRQGAFRGLVRGSGSGGGAPTRVSNAAVNRQDRPSTPLKQSTPRNHGMPGKLSARRPGGASQVSSAVNIGVASGSASGAGKDSGSFGGSRLKSPVRERRSVSAPRGATARRAVSPTPKPQSRPASPRSGSTMRRTSSPTPKTQSRPTSPRSPRGPSGANPLGGPGRSAVSVHPHTPPPPPKRSPIDARDNEHLPRRGGAGTPHSPSSQHSVVVRASGAAPGGASYWKHTGVAPVALHGGAAADHAVLASVLPVNDSVGVGKQTAPAVSDSGSLLGGAAAPPMPL